MFIQHTIDSQQNEIKIEDLDIDTLQEMLKYMYAGTIDKLSAGPGRLLEAAEKYQLSELKRMCEVWNKYSSEYYRLGLECAGGTV